MNLQLATSGWGFCNTEMFSASPGWSCLLSTYSEAREGARWGDAAERGICPVSKCAARVFSFSGRQSLRFRDESLRCETWCDTNLVPCSSPGSCWVPRAASDRTFIAGATSAAQAPQPLSSCSANFLRQAHGVSAQNNPETLENHSLGKLSAGVVRTWLPLLASLPVPPLELSVPAP